MKTQKPAPTFDPTIACKASQRTDDNNSRPLRSWLSALPIFIIILISIWISACNMKPNKDRLQYEIEELESEVTELYRDTGKSDLTISRSVNLRDAYLNYADSWSTDSLTAEYLFQAAMIDADIQNDVSTGIQYLERIIRDFPEHPIRPKTLFLIGFTYAEQLHDYQKAQVAYQQYLDEYPDGDMAASVRIEIETLGHTPLLPINPDSTISNSPDSSTQP